MPADITEINPQKFVSFPICKTNDPKNRSSMLEKPYISNNYIIVTPADSQIVKPAEMDVVHEKLYKHTHC
jgi:hypothetical protein